jgi:hypothetical protein
LDKSDGTGFDFPFISTVAELMANPHIFVVFIFTSKLGYQRSVQKLFRNVGNLIEVDFSGKIL